MEIYINVPDSLSELDEEAALTLQSQVSAALINLGNVARSLDAIVFAPKRIEAMIAELLVKRDGPQPNPEDPDAVFPRWIKSTGAHNAYPRDYIVSHLDKLWVSIVANNSEEPGISGWREKVPEGSYVTWYQPAGGHDAFSFGDIVEHLGQLWISNVAGKKTNTWAPGVYGWDVYVE